MKVIISSDNGDFDVIMNLSEEESSCGFGEHVYMCSAFCACFIDAYAKKYINQDKEKINVTEDIDKQILSVTTTIIENFYKDLAKEKEAHEEDKQSYEVFEYFFNEFLKDNNYSEEYLTNILHNNSTKLGVNFDEENAYCGVLNADTSEMLVNLCTISLDKVTDETPKEVVVAYAVSIVLYDRAFNENEQNNVARNTSTTIFEDKIREHLAKNN